MFFISLKHEKTLQCNARSGHCNTKNVAMHVAMLHHLRIATPRHCKASALALGTGVCLLPSYVIDGSYLHGPRRATVGVAVKPPDESFRRFEPHTQNRPGPYPVPTHTSTVHDPNPRRGMTDGCSKQVVSLGPYLVNRQCSPPLRG